MHLTPDEDRGLREVVAACRMRGVYTTACDDDSLGAVHSVELDSLEHHELIQPVPGKPGCWQATPNGEAWVDARYQRHEFSDETSSFDPRRRRCGLDGYQADYVCWVPRDASEEQADEFIDRESGELGLYWPDPEPESTRGWPEPKGG